MLAHNVMCVQNYSNYPIHANNSTIFYPNSPNFNLS